MMTGENADARGIIAKGIWIWGYMCRYQLPNLKFSEVPRLGHMQERPKVLKMKNMMDEQ